MHTSKIPGTHLFISTLWLNGKAVATTLPAGDRNVAARRFVALSRAVSVQS